ncbi:hypothetical protein [Pseudomonas sp. LB1P83]
MSVAPIDSSTSAPPSSEARFNAAVDKSKDEFNDAEFTESIITQAVTIGGQFIIMPKAQEMLNESMSDDDEE